MELLIRWPWLALLPALGFALAWRASRRRVVLVAAVLRLVYAADEWGIRAGRLCDPDCSMRVDLLLIYPALLALSLWAAVATWRAARARRAA
jgi:hypothetical protein